MKAAKKYYDFAAKYEVNDLHSTGIYGIRVLMYGTSLDSPGRRELLSMQSVQSYFPCHQCMHSWQPGLSKVLYGGYRRFLPPNHPYREKKFNVGALQYEFRDVEERGTPVLRTDTLVGLAILRARPSRPFLGHKAKPLLWNWVGADWGRSVPDRMHDLKCFTEMVLKCLVGPADGIYAGWAQKDGQHRRECHTFAIFDDFVAGGRPPWRLTAAQKALMDTRVKSMWWTHYSDKLAWKGHSFWTKSDRMWKAKHKILILLTILPTCLRGFVAATHYALMLVVDALRQLDGQFIAVQEAVRLGLDPHDSSIVDESLIKDLGRQLLEGLVLLEGSLPVSHLNPAMHHLVHYAADTARAGILSWLSMNSFERNNKRMKGMVRSNQNPEAGLAKDTQLDIAARVSTLSQDLDDDAQPPPLITLSRLMSGGLYVPTRRHRYCLSLLGVTRFDCIQGYNAAWIRGIHFSCGEWGRRTCGSVFTTVYCGKSVYGIFDRFMLVHGVEYAAVTWLTQPVYPYAPLTLVVRVRVLPAVDQPLHRCVIRCDRVEPCPVNVMPDENGHDYYMMRTRGYDRRISVVN